MPEQELSIREFARREGVSHTLVQNRIKSGHLPTLPNGRVSTEMLGTAWRKGAPPGAPEPRKSILANSDIAAVASNVESPEEAAERIVFREGRVFETEAEAKRHKESYLALLRELEYDRESGLVVEVAESAKQIGQEYAAVRSRLLAIPNKVAPRAALLSSPDEVRALVEAEVVEALKELTLDAGGSA